MCVSVCLCACVSEKALVPHSSTLAWKAAVHGVATSWTRLSDFTFMYWRRKRQPTLVFLPGEYQGRGSLVAAVYGVAQSRTRLKRLSSSSSSSLLLEIASLDLVRCLFPRIPIKLFLFVFLYMYLNIFCLFCNVY